MSSLVAHRPSIRRAAGSIAAAALVLATLAPPARAAEDVELSSEIRSLLEAEPLPPVAVGPRRRYLVLVHERGLLELEQLAEPVIEIAGRKINPTTTARHAPIDYYALTVVDLATREHKRVALPEGVTVGFPEFSPDGSKFAFTVQRTDGTELWVGDPRTAYAHRVAGSLNASRGKPCTWTPRGNRLLCKRLTDAAISGAGSPGSRLGRIAQQASYGQPVMLSSELTRALLESQLVLVDGVSGHHYEVGTPAAIESVRPAPTGGFMLVSRIHKPYPRVSGVDRVLRVTEIWDRSGNVVERLPDGIRAATWNISKPATVTWVEQRDGADHVVSLAPPYERDATSVFELPNTFSGLRWLADTGQAIVNDYAASEGRTTMWRVDFDAVEPEPERLASYASNAPRIPIMEANSRSNDAVLVDDNAFYVRGSADTEHGPRAFLDRISLIDGTTQRVWRGSRSGYETVVDVLDAGADRLLTRFETSTEAPNYFVSTGAGESLWAVTRYEHPAPPLTNSRRIRLAYTRGDGVGLGASLHLPPGYSGEQRLPLVVWAYPHRVAPAEDAPRAEPAEDRFPGFERAFRLFFLLRGYAVLDNVSMPIVGSRGEANDTFIEQIIANSRAAIGAAEGTGFVDASRVAVAGHSYGAFMVANLLAHSELFEAGAALSGAYNRTLTPFGFQTERRTLWEAPDTYLAMSPILYSHRIEAPLLLVHGLLDDNAGTSPLQSTQFYEAIRGNGGNAGLLLLPWEGHSYRARESVMQTASRLLEWFDRHVKSKPSADIGDGGRQAGAYVPPSQVSARFIGMPQR